MNYNNNSKPTLESTILNSIRGSLVDTHTTLIAKITKVNKKTIDCKPVISRLVNNKAVDLPIFVDVPIINFLGGSSSIQMPLAVEDYAVLFVVERCFDEWYSGNDFKPPLEARIHDYSDCIALVGLKNMSGELDIPTVIKMMGDCHQTGNYTHLGNRVQTGNYNITGNVTINGNLAVNGNITITNGDITIDGISFKNHKHGGVQTGGSLTGVAQ